MKCKAFLRAMSSSHNCSEFEIARRSTTYNKINSLTKSSPPIVRQKIKPFSEWLLIILHFGKSLLWQFFAIVKFIEILLPGSLPVSLSDSIKGRTLPATDQCGYSPTLFRSQRFQRRIRHLNIWIMARPMSMRIFFDGLGLF